MCHQCGLSDWRQWIPGHNDGRYYKPRYVSYYKPYGLKVTNHCLYPSSDTDYYLPQLLILRRPSDYQPVPPQVSRQRLLLKGPHGRDEVMRNYGFEVSDQLAIEAMKKQLDDERVQVREWASDTLRTRMLETALRLDMRFKGKRINKHKDIKNSWNEDQSDENAGKMYHVMFGDYESKNASWSKMMERQYMESCDREYLPGEPMEKTQKGCYERIITKSKTIQVRMMNKGAICSIYMSLPHKLVETIPAEQRTKIRRKGGDYYIVNAESVSDPINTGS